MGKKVETIRVTKKMVTAALEAYEDGLDWAYLAGAFQEHQRAMRRAIRAALKAREASNG